MFERGKMGLEMEQGILCLAGACALVLLIVGWQKKTEVLRNFLLRLVTGTALIFAVNFLLAEAGIEVHVGFNPFSLLSAGTLGVPGVAMLYGIAGCRLL